MGDKSEKINWPLPRDLLSISIGEGGRGGRGGRRKLQGMEPTEVRGGGEFSRSLIMVGGRGVCPRQSASLDRASNSKTPGESSQGGACGGWGGGCTCSALPP